MHAEDQIEAAWDGLYAYLTEVFVNTLDGLVEKTANGVVFSNAHVGQAQEQAARQIIDSCSLLAPAMQEFLRASVTDALEAIAQDFIQGIMERAAQKKNDVIVIHQPPSQWVN
jgi:hypothetical protein